MKIKDAEYWRIYQFDKLMDAVEFARMFNLPLPYQRRNMKWDVIF